MLPKVTRESSPGQADLEGAAVFMALETVDGLPQLVRTLGFAVRDVRRLT